MMLFTRSASAESLSEGGEERQELTARLFTLEDVQDILRELGEVSCIFESYLNAI